VSGLLAALLVLLAGLTCSGLWIAGVAYIYFDARRRNVGHPGIWALAALFCGPLALVAYLIDRPKGVQTECGFCTRTVLESDQTCPYCGRELDGIAVPRDRA
jgi:Ni/Fe-hydrogenase subunit HybB-like protein